MLIEKQSQDANNTVLAGYKSVVESGFDAKVDDVDFATQGPQIMSRVNEWVKEKTHGLISKILDQPLPESTILMLLNTIYFKGKWDQDFDPRSTTKRTFYNKGVNGVQTDFMQQTGIFKVLVSENLNGHGVKVLALPYEKYRYSMMIVLPDQRDGLKALLADSDFKNKVMSMLTSQNFTRSTVYLKLPKFKLESEYDLVPALQGLGVREIFGGGDLSGIRGTHDLKVSTMKHKAVVKVDEEGTEAAAYTYGIPMPASSYVPPSWDIVVDHPFLFFIKDTQTGMILFAGKVEELSTSTERTQLKIPTIISSP